MLTIMLFTAYTVFVVGITVAALSPWDWKTPAAELNPDIVVHDTLVD